MQENTITIACPNCGKTISLDDALTHKIEEKFKGKYEQEARQKDLELAAREADIKKQELDIEKQKTSIELKVAEQVKQETRKIETAAKIKASEELSGELNLLKEELKDKNTKLGEAQKAELELRKERAKLESDKQAFEIEVQRKLDGERNKIKSDAVDEYEKLHHFKDAEKDTKISSLSKTIEELNRKLLQGSQQTQGEVLELELEALLKTNFVYDEISPVAKGVSGADVIQKVKDNFGRDCGIIVWESKHTKNWSDGWIPKLKDDQRTVKAETAVLVSQSLPSDVKTFAQLDGVWVTNFDCCIPVASVLRSALIQLSATKMSVVGKNEKMEVIYNYLCGTEFKQKIEAIVEAFVSMKQDLDGEKRATERLWAKREKQIERVVNNTSQMYGDLQGLIGNSMPSIAALDIPALEEPKKS